mgnify:CR=1 FL=1
MLHFERTISTKDSVGGSFSSLVKLFPVKVALMGFWVGQFASIKVMLWLLQSSSKIWASLQEHRLQMSVEFS